MEANSNVQSEYSHYHPVDMFSELGIVSGKSLGDTTFWMTFLTLFLLLAFLIIMRIPDWAGSGCGREGKPDNYNRWEEGSQCL